MVHFQLGLTISYSFSIFTAHEIWLPSYGGGWCDQMVLARYKMVKSYFQKIKFGLKKVLLRNMRMPIFVVTDNIKCEIEIYLEKYCTQLSMETKLTNRSTMLPKAVPKP